MENCCVTSQRTAVTAGRRDAFGPTGVDWALSFFWNWKLSKGQFRKDSSQQANCRTKHNLMMFRLPSVLLWEDTWLRGFYCSIAETVPTNHGQARESGLHTRETSFQRLENQREFQFSVKHSGWFFRAFFRFVYSMSSTQNTRSRRRGWWCSYRI